MTIHTQRDGSVLLTDDANPSRTQLIPSGTSDADRDAAIAAFFPPVPLPVPEVVSMAKAQIALDTAGLLPGVDAAVAASPKAVQIAWAKATEIHRHSPTMLGLAAALGLTDAQVDDLFRAADAVVI